METEQTLRWQAALEGFEGVWTRVNGTEASLPSSGLHLAEMAEKARQAAEFDRCLASRLRGDGRTMLLRHARQASCRANRLRAEAFLADGVRDRESSSCPLPGHPLEALRSAMLRDEEAAEACEEAARRADGELAELFRHYAAEVQCAAAEKRSFIRRCFG